MPANKFATIRYHVIDKMLRNKYKRYPSVEEIMEKCEEVLLKPISKSSIEKDIRAMKFDEGLGYFAPIEFSRSHGGYYYDSEDYSIDTVPLNEDEIEAVKFATNILTQFKDIAIFKDYENAIEKVLDKVNFGGFRSDENVQYIQFENSPTVSGNEFLAPLLHGISTHKLVEFAYKSFKANEISKRVVEPYLLKEYKNRWYLVAREGKGSIFKVFGLERMREVEVTSDSFDRDTSFDAKNYFSYSIGITTTPGNQPKNVRLQCHPVLLQYLESQPIHHSQKIEFLPEGGIVSLFVEITYELEQFLLSFGSELTVLEPRILRESLIKKHQSAIDNYSKKQS